MGSIRKIVVTGGPCAGKTTAMSWIQNAFAQLGYTVLFVPETATELITGGVAPWTTGTNLDYQKCQMRLQLEKEALFEQAAKTMGDKKILIVCDRGALDNKAYMNEEEFKAVLEYVGKTEIELVSSYDAVFHLVSAAKGAESYYNLDNAARTETLDQAAMLDDTIIACWKHNPHLRVIDNSVEFPVKLKRVIFEIASFLGEKTPFYRGRRFLVKMPSQEFLASIPKNKRIEVVQTYLTVTNNVSEIRLRERGVGGARYYYQTMKRKNEKGESIEIEKRLSVEEYQELLWCEDTSRPKVRKTRYVIETQSCFFDLDVYPYWEDKAILEVSLGPQSGPISAFPKEIEIIQEITDDKDFDNESNSTKR